jgi:hypothetical protein
MRFGTTSDGMPIGVQLVANLYSESTSLTRPRLPWFVDYRHTDGILG